MVLSMIKVDRQQEKYRDSHVSKCIDEAIQIDFGRAMGEL